MIKAISSAIIVALFWVISAVLIGQWLGLCIRVMNWVAGR